MVSHDTSLQKSYEILIKFLIDEKKDQLSGIMSLTRKPSG